MFFDELKQIKAEGEMVSIYADRNETDVFITGYVVGVDEQFYIIAFVKPDGDFDGFGLRKIDFCRIDRGGIYIKKREKLVDIKKSKTGKSFESDDLKRELLVYAFNKETIVSIELVDSGYEDCIGLIKSVDDSMCRIQILNRYGETDGVSLIQLSDITGITCDDSEHRYLKLLYTGA